MNEIKIPVNVYKVKAVCECGGEFLPGNVVLTTYPPQYPHECNKCGSTKTFDKRYPIICYEESPNKEN